MRHMGRSQKGSRAPLGSNDAEYNRVMEARREYEKSLAARSTPEPPRKAPRDQSVTVTTAGQPKATYSVPSHADYIKSRKWHDRKIRYYQKHDKKCFACGAKDHIHLHHKTYARMGAELDADLVPLCEKCHSEVHRIQRESKRNLAEVTDQFIKKGWLEQKKRKSPAKKGAKANTTAKRKARQSKAKKVLPHSLNPVEHSSGDVAPAKRKVSKVKVTSSNGRTYQESDSAIRSRTTPAAPEPQWVKKARSSKR